MSKIGPSLSPEEVRRLMNDPDVGQGFGSVFMAEAQKQGVKLGPNSPLRGKQRKKKVDWEHQAQVRMYELLDEVAKTDRGITSGLTVYLPIIHAIPQFTDRAQSWRNKKIGAKFKAEGQKSGIPDNHIPVPRDINGYECASLYLELKYETYPSENQKRMAVELSLAGNCVLVLRKADVEELAARGCETILRYLERRRDFTEFSHESHTYLPPTLFGL